MTIWTAELGAITVYFGNTYDSRVVADEVPDEQLDNAGHQNDKKHGVCGPDLITEESRRATTNTR